MRLRARSPPRSLRRADAVGPGSSGDRRPNTLVCVYKRDAMYTVQIAWHKIALYKYDASFMHVKRIQASIVA